jgi:3-hydroxyacyl-CoA dehydrogenase
VKEEVKISKHFCGTHFFNPARYLKLFEIIPVQTSSEVLDFLQYMEKFLGKTSVVAKDTPAFIGNRIGIYGIQVCSTWLKKWD